MNTRTVIRRTFPIMDGYIVRKNFLFPEKPKLFDSDAPVYYRTGSRRGVFRDYLAASIIWIAVYPDETTYFLTVSDPIRGPFEVMVGPAEVFPRIATQALPFTARVTDESEQVELYPYQREMLPCRFNDPRISSNNRTVPEMQ